MPHTNDTIKREMAALFERGFVVIDFETTGFVSPTVEIIEVAIMDHHGAVLLDTLVKPTQHIPSGASRVNGIYDHDVQGAPGFLAVYPKLLRHLSGQPVVAYNYTFERGILGSVTGRYGLSIRVDPWVCAMRKYAALKGYGRFAKLTTAAAAEGITVADAHRALGDVRMTLALMQRMAGG